MYQGLAINVPPEDYFKQKLEEVKEAGMQWAELAKKVRTMKFFYSFVLETTPSLLTFANDAGCRR